MRRSSNVVLVVLFVAIVMLVQVVPAGAVSLSSISPTSGYAGGPAFTLTLNAGAWGSASSYTFHWGPTNTMDLPKGSSSIQIPASYIATAGTFNVWITDSNSKSSQILTFMVNAPAALTAPTSITMTPSSPHTNDDLVAQASGSTGTGTLIYSYSWSKNSGTTWTGWSNSGTLGSASTTKGDTWQVKARATDAYGGTSPEYVRPASVTILDTPPTAPTTVTVAPAAPITTDDLVASASGAGDIDGDNIGYNYKWQKWNGTAWTDAGVTGDRVGNALTTGGEQWRALAQAVAAGATSDWVASAGVTIIDPAPTVTSITPNSGATGTTVNITDLAGTGFLAGATVQLQRQDGIRDTTADSVTVVSPTQITCSLDLAGKAVGVRNVIVTNSNGASVTLPGGFTVLAAPTVLTVSNITGTPGDTVQLAAVLTVRGTPLQGATITFTVDGSNLGATTDAAGTATVDYTLPAGATIGDHTITATFAGDADYAASSGTGTLTVNNPAPTITSLSPSSATAGGLDFTLTVNGTGFVGTSKVNWGGVERTTTYVSDTSLTAAITAADIASAGTVNVTVSNPAPGGGTSDPSTFTISIPPPSTPTVVCIGPDSSRNNANVSVSIAGTGFLTGATVTLTLGEETITATNVRVSGTTNITCSLPLTGATAGLWDVVVTNTDGGAGTLAGGFMVIATSTTLAVSPASGQRGAVVSLTATLTPHVSGKSITFTVDGVNAGSTTTDGSGVATVNYTIPTGATIGDHTIQADFAGDATYGASSGTANLTVTAPPTYTIVRGSGYFFNNGNSIQRCNFSFRFNASLMVGSLTYADFGTRKTISLNSVQNIVLTPDNTTGPQATITWGTSPQYTLVMNAETNSFSITGGAYSAQTSKVTGDIIIEVSATP